MAQKYEFTASCEFPGCPTKEFKRVKDKSTYMASDDCEVPIDRILCPSCGLLAHVTSIRSAPIREVA